MKQIFAVLLLLGAGAPASIAGQAQPQVSGSWEAARTANDERLYVVLGKEGKAEIVTEYYIPLPGPPGKQRVRSSTYGKWTRHSSDVVITYANIQDRLRYVAHQPLTALGLSGTAPALKPVGKVNAKSQIGSEVLWKAPHEYRAKAGESSQTPIGAAEPAQPEASPAPAPEPSK
ncbi:MAG TPA: hypothetical protein VMH26_14570 [Burkholderiales bacterium]|nr:hypothetical protein [Burkholderiales bacterium]